MFGRFWGAKRFFTTKPDFSPTIYALSTKPGRSAIGVVRISGSQSQYIFHKLTNGTSKLPKSRYAGVRKLYDPTETSLLLDEALVLYFQSPKSYTGEDLLELHLHGGTAIVKSVLQSIEKLHKPKQGINIRYAEQGEFSRRAFINGRFDLTTIEGIREMIDAETETQRVAALASMKGDTKQVFAHWRDQILNNVALLTTVIDFGEDHDLEEVAELFDTVESNISKLTQEIEQYLIKVQKSTILLQGIKLLLLGPPNAGKSSLLNQLANKDAAIVSNIAGTTRDIIDIPLDISGYKVVVGDTAGIRNHDDSTDVIELEGIKRAKSKSYDVDIVVVVLSLENSPRDLDSSLIQHLKVLQQQGKRIIVALNKQDMLDPSQTLLNEFAAKLNVSNSDINVVSCESGHGLKNLNFSLTNAFKEITLTENTDPVIISSRVQDILKNDVLYSFDQFSIWKKQDDVVLATESLRSAIDGIGKITGETIGVEEILGVVFSSFCIGK